MKREDIKKFFPDATEEQLKGLLDINTAERQRESLKQ